MRHVVGICGEARSGKDTIADYLSNEYGFRKIAFADRLKQLLNNLFFLTHSQLYDGERKEEVDLQWGKSPRVLMQEVGDKMREVHPDIWVKHVINHVDAISDADFVISDVRYRSEFDAIKALGGEVWSVRRPDGPKIKTKDHISETELQTIPDDFFDNIIVNKTISEALKEVDYAMKALRLKK